MLKVSWLFRDELNLAKKERALKEVRNIIAEAVRKNVSSHNAGPKPLALLLGIIISPGLMKSIMKSVLVYPSEITENSTILSNKINGENGGRIRLVRVVRLIAEPAIQEAGSPLRAALPSFTVLSLWVTALVRRRGC